MNRRRVLQALAATASGAAAGGLCWNARNARAAGDGPRFLIVLCAFGGGAIIDSFLPVKESEATDPNRLDCFPDDQVIANASLSPLRVADAKITSLLGQPLGGEIALPLSPVAAKHYQQMMVTTLQHTSVNHAVAQHRAVTGGGVWNGRTLQEMVALTYGEGRPLPNVNMAGLGFGQPGADDSLPDYAYAEVVPQPLFKPLSLSGSRGINGLPPDQLIALARGMRDGELDPESSFYQTFRYSDRLALWRAQRAEAAPAIENAALVDKLIFFEEKPEIPLSQYGLMASEDAPILAQAFPDLLNLNPSFMDPLEQQAALAFLLLKHGVSVAVTLAPSFQPVLGTAAYPSPLKNPPLAFDGAHNDHRSAQALMWYRVLNIADKLIDLLKATPYDDETGETMWDRTMIHFATDFGRDKRRPLPQPPATDPVEIWGTAHDLNNGTLTISPLVNGNTVLGGVYLGESVELDGHTYGFDLQTGAPDTGRLTSEAEHYAGLLGALGVDTAGSSLPDVPAMRKQG